MNETKAQSIASFKGVEHFLAEQTFFVNVFAKDFFHHHITFGSFLCKLKGEEWIQIIWVLKTSLTWAWSE